MVPLFVCICALIFVAIFFLLKKLFFWWGFQRFFASTAFLVFRIVFFETIWTDSNCFFKFVFNTACKNSNANTCHHNTSCFNKKNQGGSWFKPEISPCQHNTNQTNYNSKQFFLIKHFFYSSYAFAHSKRPRKRSSCRAFLICISPQGVNS